MQYTAYEDIEPGDTVVLVGDEWTGDQGKRAVVADREGTHVTFKATEEGFTRAGWYIYEGWELFKVPEQENGSPEVSYYQFPRGVEVRDISAYLTSFGGQALQYIARSCRLDGGNKGERVRDLRKARDMIDWEIYRLEQEIGKGGSV